MTIHRILVGVDGSDSGFRAVDFAAALARQTAAVLDVVAVIDLGQLDFYDGIYMTTDQIDALQTRVKTEVLDHAKSRVPKDIAIEGSVLRGAVTRVMVERIESTKADLLVVGRTGRGMLEQLVDGSTARKLSRTSPVPVLIVP